MSAPPPEPAQSRWDVVALAVMGGVMVGLTAGKVPPALAEIGTDLGMDRVTAGWLASLYFAVGAGCAVIAGMLGSRTSARAMVVGGLVVMAAGAAAGAFAPSSGLLLAMRVVEGIGFTTVAVAGPKLIFDATRPADRDVALGIWSIFMPAGMALAMLGTTLLLGELGWRGVWLLSVAVMLAFALLILAGTGTRRFPGQSRPEPGAPLDWAGGRATLARPVLWYYAGAFLLYTVSWFAVAAWLPTFLVETQARSAMAAGLFTALVVGANMGGNLSGGWLLARGWHRWSLLALAFATMAVTAVLIIGPFTGDGAKIPLAIVFSMVSGVLPAAAIAGTAAHAPRPHLVPMSSGFAMQGAAIGMLIGPPLLAIVVGAVGSWENAWWAMLVCPALGLAVAAGVWGAERRRAS